MLRKYFFPLLVLIISGCQTNPPDIYEVSTEYVNVYISTDISGAEIFVDHNTSGKFTPDTITVTAGEHLFSLKKQGFVTKDTLVNVIAGNQIDLFFSLTAASVEKIVLIEDFANVSCDPCVISNQILHSFETNSYGKKIAVIKYPTYWPGANDPFYLHAKAEADARIGYYNIINAPTIIVDGTLKPLALDSNKIKLAIDTKITQIPKFKIEIIDSLTGDYLHADVFVTLIDTAGINFDEMVLHTAIIESEIQYSTPPGSNGETRFYNVIRKKLPSTEGELLKNMNYEYHRALTCSSVWDKSKIKVVAFIQNKTTREIYQAASTD